VSAPLLRWASSYVRPHRRRLAAVLLLSLASTALALVVPLLSRDLVDRALLGRDGAALLRIVGAFVGFTAAGFVLNVASGLLYTRTSADVLFAMRLDVYRHLQRLSPRFYARTPLGDVVSRLNNDVSEVQRVAAETVLASVGNVLFLVGTVAMLVVLAPRMALVSFVFLPVSLWALVHYRRRLAAKVGTLRQRSADVGTFLIETLQGMRLVVASGAEDREAGRFRARNASFVQALVSMQLFTYLAGGLPGLLLSAGAAAVFLWGGYDVIAGRLSVGTFVAFMAYQMRLLPPLQALMGLYASLATGAVSLGRVREILDAAPEVVELPSAEPAAFVRGDVELSGVTFAFDRGQPVLDRVSFRVAPGEVVAVVGPSGGGKSTIADLLVRLFDPDEGTVRLDGRDLRTFRLADVRRHVGLVEQTPFLFHATIAENLRYARPDATDAEVAAAAEAAGLGDLVARLPRRYETMVGERGSALSAGERQRLAIARAFLARPTVLVLDEPTAALDPETERQVLAGFEALMRGRTTILVSHRRLLAERADRVIVLDGARVVEDGPARELAGRAGPFRALFGSA
jgi:ATP-binding cassette, subfamily B, bacterial